MDKTEILKEKLADAEVVLIGIGEEFNEKFDRIAEHEQLVKGLELVDAKEELDGLIQKAGFKPEKIVEPCGNYEKMQCSAKCSTKLYESEEYANKIKEALQDGTLEQVEQPVCPDCGAPLAFNNIVCENYVEEGYLPQWQKYTKWLTLTLNHRLCILELGVGMNLPNVIRWPFEKVAFYNQKASFFRINESLYQIAEDMGDKGIGIEENACDFLREEI